MCLRYQVRDRDIRATDRKAPQNVNALLVGEGLQDRYGVREPGIETDLAALDFSRHRKRIYRCFCRIQFAYAAGRLILPISRSFITAFS